LRVLVQLSRQFGCRLNRPALFACFKESHVFTI
jgi:hypothetical protein